MTGMLQNAQALASPMTNLQTNSEITTLQKERHLQIGMPLSSHGLETLRNSARGIRAGVLLEDNSLQALLTQHFGQRLKLKKIHNSEYDIVKYEVEFSEVGANEETFLIAFQTFNEPANPQQVQSKLAAMRVLLVKKAESENDMEFALSCLGEVLNDVPNDVLNAVVRDIMRTQKFFPAPCEILALCKPYMLFRKAVYEALRKSWNKTIQSLPTTETKQIEATP